MAAVCVPYNYLGVSRTHDSYQPLFTKLLGNNPISVLATLILLSYAKILRTLIIAVYIIHLEYPGNYNKGVAV